MYIDEIIRNKLYFFLDKLKGGFITTKLSQLNMFEQADRYTQLEIIEEKLNELLSDITNNVPWYKEYKGRELSAFPIINKKTIIQNPDIFMSDKYAKENLIPVNTSGSYGTPMTYYLTSQKKQSQLAEVIYHGQKSGYEVGLRHGYFRTVPYKSKLKFWMQNEVFFSSKKLNSDFVDNGIKCLRAKKIKCLIGFPSSIAFLARNCIDRGFSHHDFNVESVITSSENLSVQQREIIEKAFRCVIHNRYSTEELGVVAQQYEKDGPFIVNTFNYIVEILKLTSDEAVEKGEVGRIVVTDLHSNAMPLIRYETGDLGVLGEPISESRPWVSKISRLSGRSIQIIFSTDGVALYPLYFECIMEKFKEFSQFQIIQTAQDRYTLNLVPRCMENISAYDKTSLLKEFYDWLGYDANLEVQFVSDIEMLPSGKRPYIINRYKTF